MTHTCSAAVTRLRDWHRYLSALRQRRLWVWSGSVCVSALKPLWQAFPAPHVWIGAAPPEALPRDVHFLTLKQARTQLGREVGTLVVDAREQFDADAFGAIAGALTGGGVAIVVTADTVGAADGLFDQWRRQVMAEDPYVLSIPDGGLAALPIPPAQPVSPSRGAAVPPIVRSESRLAWPLAQQQAITADQRQALMVLKGAPERAVTVLTAARGRGKSAVLGLAVAAWLQEGAFETLWLTAPRAVAVEALFERVQCLCPEGRRDGNRFQLGERALQFIAPDALIQQLQDEGTALPEVLLVDEAAALPLPFLRRWLSRCPHVVLSTTLHGYEGSAHGFTDYIQQLQQRLHSQTHAAGVLHYELLMPIRWAADDPLEALTARLLRLEAAPCPVLANGALHIETVGQAQLLAQPALLDQVFGLLVQAHYRTSPSDLQTLLDHPALSLWAACVASETGVSQVAAVVMAFDEGGLSEDLAQAVADGRRRPPGHLLPQTLALHTGNPEVARQRWRRITRIAVHPECRRQGIGSRLLAHVHHASAQDGIDLLGVSFGGKPSTLAFWQHNGFTTVRVGLKDDTVTGERAVMMARECRKSHVSVASLSGLFWPTFIVQLAFELAELSPMRVAALLRDRHKSLPPTDGTERDALRRFGEEKAPLASVRPFLQRALLRYADALTLEEVAVMAGMLLQGRSETWAKTQLPQLAGKRAFEQWLRGKVALWARYSAC